MGNEEVNLAGTAVNRPQNLADRLTPETGVLESCHVTINKRQRQKSTESVSNTSEFLLHVSFNICSISILVFAVSVF